jgi:DNA helicase-2/ATP-dependent DNA helicase PcrA
MILYAPARQEVGHPPDELAIAFTGTGETVRVTHPERVLANHTANIDRLLEAMHERRGNRHSVHSAPPPLSN